MPATETVDNEEKLCLQCKKPLGPGKLGKKFCDEYCRSEYHNQRNREKKNATSVATTPVPVVAPVDIKPKYPKHLDSIHHILIKNREIMSEICDEGRSCRIWLRTLLGRGFNPKFFTSQTEPNRQGKVYRFCYEYGYHVEEDGMAVVICRPSEIYL